MIYIFLCSMNNNRENTSHPNYGRLEEEKKRA